MKRNRRHRGQTAQDRAAEIYALWAAYGESLAALAWQGYQDLGRGCLAYERDASGLFYVCKEEIDYFAPNDPPGHRDAMHRITDDYDPHSTVAFVMRWPKSNGFTVILMSPPVPPPLAQLDHDVFGPTVRKPFPRR
jgi:hypothetical protein